MPSEKHGELAGRIREEIVRGRFAPGKRLPARTQLTKRYDVSSATLQLAMHTLADEGFVTGMERRGTVVAEYPPHLSHYGILFGHEATPEKPWMRSWQAIAEAAREILDQRPNRLSFFYVGDLQRTMASYQAFLDDVAAHRLAGLIVPGVPVPHLADLVAGSGGRLPIVAYSGEVVQEGVATTRETQVSLPTMIDYLATRGRRKIGLVASGAWFERADSTTELENVMAEFGVRSESCWQQVEIPEASRAVRNVAELLARDPDGPDALVLQDDNAVQEAIDGIQAAGKRVGEDIELVAWGNFPWHEEYSAPVKRFGVDMWQFVRRAKRYIDAHRRGEQPEPVIELDTMEGAGVRFQVSGVTDRPTIQRQVEETLFEKSLS
jgi:DNA-binding LacI/PurR family transcriptional regulator